jgi:hypothetical protein
LRIANRVNQILAGVPSLAVTECVPKLPARVAVYAILYCAVNGSVDSIQPNLTAIAFQVKLAPHVQAGVSTFH